MLLDTLGATLLGNMLTEKGMLRAGYGNKEGKGVIYLKKIKDRVYVKNLDEYADVGTH